MAESKHLILAPSREAAIASDASSTPLTHRLVFGALAGMGAATFCHPLDVIRVQMQMEGVQYNNTMDAATKIYSRSGLVEGLYAGVSAAYLRQWMYGSFCIGIYSYLLEQTQNENERMGRDKNDIPFSRKLAMGCCSGGIGSFIGTPSELALVRRWGCEYHLTNSGWFGHNGSWGYGLLMMFCSTLCSSFVANIVANPFDVIKSRMQNMTIDANGRAPYKSMSNCFVKSVNTEGLLVLYKGFTPAFVKLGVY